MNDEIKEIKHRLQLLHAECNPKAREEDINYTLDYITNLQRENENIKDSVDWWKDRFFGQQEYDDSHRITAIEYKKRIDEVIEYIENRRIEYLNANEDSKSSINEWHYKMLLDKIEQILRGE